MLDTCPITASCEVLVCGGGTAGAVAAITAARAGANTLVVEQLGLLGGTQAAAWVTPMMPNKLLQESLTHGLNDEILQRAAQYDPPPTDRSGDLLWFNPVTLAMVLDDLLAESGARVLYHTWISEAVVRDPPPTPSPGGRGLSERIGNRSLSEAPLPLGEGLGRGLLTGVIVENKSGRGRINAQVTIDATGDADVAYRAGVPCVSGDPETGRRQPLSLRFALAGVDLERAAAFLADDLGMECWSRPPLFEIWAGKAENTPLGPLIRQAVAGGVLEDGDLGYLQFFAMLGRPGELAFNCPRLTGLDPTNAWDLSAAQTVGRRKIRRIYGFFRAYVRGFERSYIGTVAPMIGVRDSRRIIGDYTLTEADYFGQARFPDAVARNSYPIDIHDPHSPTGTVLKKMPPGGYHEIPYRCLLPQGMDNLLVAGRCLSATFAAQAAVRIQQNCRALGEAAGLAAAMSVAAGIPPRHIDTDELRRRLNAQGARI